MESSISQNANLILSIKQEALGSGLFEAFLESAPQFILQCSIILKTGKISKFGFVLLLNTISNVALFTALS
jgi:hypothetical protein